MFFIFLILFTGLPVLELYILFQASDVWGGLNTLSVVIMTGIFGAYFAKREGRSVIRKLQQKLNQGGLPANEVIHGFLIFAGGILLLTPGFVTDIIGLSFVFPLTRVLHVKILLRYLKNKIKTGQMHVYTNVGDQHFYSDMHSHHASGERDVTNDNNVIELNPRKKDDD